MRYQVFLLICIIAIPNSMYAKSALIPCYNNILPPKSTSVPIPLNSEQTIHITLPKNTATINNEQTHNARAQMTNDTCQARYDTNISVAQMKWQQREAEQNFRIKQSQELLKRIPGTQQYERRKWEEYQIRSKIHEQSTRHKIPTISPPPGK